MLVPYKPVQWLAVIALVVLTLAQCQDNERRRAVTEHQLMHDRGRTIQSLKRLIWLSSAMEGLHTAQTRSLLLPLNLGLSPALLPSSAEAAQPARADSQQQVAMENLLRDFFSPQLTGLSDRER